MTILGKVDDREMHVKCKLIKSTEATIGTDLVSSSSFVSFFLILHPKDKNTHDDSLSAGLAYNLTLGLDHNPEAVFL